MARRKQQEAQQSGVWHDLVKRMRPQHTPPETTALVTARDVEQRVQEMLGPPPEPPIAPKGVYLYGSVGSGKSLLMAMFYSVVTEHNLVPNKRRMHFNAAMLEAAQAGTRAA